MWRTADVHQPTIQPFGLERLYRTSRIVGHRLDEGRRVDSFESRSRCFGQRSKTRSICTCPHLKS